MRPHIDTMRENIAKALLIDVGQVNVKATTEEGLGFTGSGEGISSQAICLVTTPFDLTAQALQRMDGRNDCGNYHDRDEYIGTSDSEYGEKGIDPWHQRRCDRVCTGSIVPLWNRNGQSDFPGET